MKVLPRNSRWLCLCLSLLAQLSLLSASHAQEPALVLLIQPIQREDVTRRAFQPLLEQFEQATGRRFVIATTPNFLAHWQTVRRNVGFDLVLDDAHFTDYRVQKFGFHVLAKVPGMSSYSLATARGTRLRSPLDLAGKKVASFGPPSIGATRLSAMFPNPARRPAIIEVASSTDGLSLLEQGKVTAVMLPTAALTDHVNVISTAEPSPNMALSISPRIDPRTREKIRAALLRPGGVDSNLQREAGIGGFESTDAAYYAGQSRILRDFWGY
jgi:hypothetical protein